MVRIMKTGFDLWLEQMEEDGIDVYCLEDEQAEDGRWTLYKSIRKYGSGVPAFRLESKYTLFRDVEAEWIGTDGFDAYRAWRRMARGDCCWD